MVKVGRKTILHVPLLDTDTLHAGATCLGEGGLFRLFRHFNGLKEIVWLEIFCTTIKLQFFRHSPGYFYKIYNDLCTQCKRTCLIYVLRLCFVIFFFITLVPDTPPNGLTMSIFRFLLRGRKQMADIVFRFAALQTKLMGNFTIFLVSF